MSRPSNNLSGDPSSIQRDLDDDKNDYLDYDNNDYLDGDGDDEPINQISKEVVFPGTKMVNFNGEKRFGRYYTKRTYNMLIRDAQQRRQPFINPFTRHYVNMRSVRPYTIKKRGLPTPWNAAKKRAKNMRPGNVDKAIKRIKSIFAKKGAIDLTDYQRILATENPSNIQLLEIKDARNELTLLKKLLEIITNRMEDIDTTLSRPEIEKQIREIILHDLTKIPYLGSFGYVSGYVSSGLGVTVMTFIFLAAALGAATIATIQTGGIVVACIILVSVAWGLGENVKDYKKNKQVEINLTNLSAAIPLIDTVLEGAPITERELEMGTMQTNNPLYGFNPNTAEKSQILNRMIPEPNRYRPNRNFSGLTNRLTKRKGMRGFLNRLLTKKRR